MTKQPARSDGFEAYADALLRHHLMLSEGKEDGPEMEQVEDQLAHHWEELDEAQQQQMRGVSSDLNWIRRGCAQAQRAKTREQVTPEELREFYQFNEAQAFAQTLTALRVCAAAVPPVFVAFVRGRCYSHLGLRPIANLFFRTAIELGNKESMLSRVAFDELVQLSPSDAFEQSNRIIDKPEKYAPISVAQAITFAIGFLGGDPTMFARDDLAEKLRQASKRLDEAAPQQEVRVRFLMVAGAQLASFGQVDEGIGFLDQALKIEPNNAELLSWLGEALYQKDRDRAVSLLKQSIAAGTRLVRPYLVLANHYLSAKDFNQAKSYSGHVVEMGHDDFSVAIGLEVLAICLYEQGAPYPLVLDLLRRAHTLAPGIQRIANNLASFEQFMRGRMSPAVWDTDEPQTQFEIRERWVPGKHQLIPT